MVVAHLLMCVLTLALVAVMWTDAVLHGSRPKQESVLVEDFWLSLYERSWQ